MYYSRYYTITKNRRILQVLLNKNVKFNARINQEQINIVKVKSVNKKHLDSILYINKLQKAKNKLGIIFKNN